MLHLCAATLERLSTAIVILVAYLPLIGGNSQLMAIIPTLVLVSIVTALNLYIVLPYSGLFSRGVNFPEFPEWTRDSGNFILDC